jgi:hypothetical protein
MTALTPEAPPEGTKELTGTRKPAACLGRWEGSTAGREEYVSRARGRGAGTGRMFGKLGKEHGGYRGE